VKAMIFVRVMEKRDLSWGIRLFPRFPSAYAREALPKRRFSRA